MKTKILLVLGSVACLTLPVGMAQTRSAADLYQEALHAQEVKGDLGKAIELYRTIVDRYPTDQAIAPKALLEMASDYEKLGKPEAVNVYQRILREYAGSGAIAAAAQNKLANGSQKDPGTVLRQTNYGDLDTISSDGHYSPFENKNGDLALLDLASGRQRALTHCEPSNECSADISVPSPDTRFIAYNWFTRTRGPDDKSFNISGGPFTVDLRVISRDGGQPRIVYPNVEKARYLEPAGWTPDGKSVLVMLQKVQGGFSDLMLIPVSGGTPRLIKHFDTRWFNVEISPDGRSIAATVPAAADKPERDIVSISLDTGREQIMLKHPADDYLLGWFPQAPSRILFASDRGGTYGIWAVRVVDGRTEGEPVLVRRDTGRVSPVGFTRNGSYHYGVNETWREVSVATLDTATGKQVGSPVRLEGRYLGGMSAPAWSPTGDRIAYVQATTATSSSQGAVSLDLSLNKKLAIQTVSTGEVRLLTVALDNIATIVWQPDGRSLIAQGRDPQGQGLFAVNAENGAVTNIQRGGASPALSPDGRRVFYRFGPPPAAQTNEAQGIASRDLGSGAQQTITTQAVARFALSPDGKWLASTTPRVGDAWPKAYVTASSGGESRPLHPAVSGWTIDPVIAWSSDNRSVFVVTVVRRQPNVHEIWQVPLDGSAPRTTGITWSGEAARFEAIDAHPDGRRLAVSTVKNRWTSWVLENIPSQIGK